MKANFTAEELAEMIMSTPCFEEAERCFVSVYRRHRFYGGPEEGGWWYDRSEFVGSCEFKTKPEAEAFLKYQTEKAEQANREEAPDRYRAMAALPDPDEYPLPDSGEGFIPTGWDDGGELYVTIEDTKGESDNMNDETPRYE